MSVIRFFLVLICFIAICYFSFFLLHLCSRKIRQTIPKVVINIVIILIAIIVVFLLCKYNWPFDQNIELELVYTIDVPPEYAMEGPQNLPWHAAYEAFGFHACSLYFDPAEKKSSLGFCWPDMDFEHYTYIISYGQEVESLSYNVWDTIDTPFHTGAKAGYAVLSERFDSNKVYVYQIPKMRIDNNQ